MKKLIISVKSTSSALDEKGPKISFFRRPFSHLEGKALQCFVLHSEASFFIKAIIIPDEAR